MRVLLCVSPTCFCMTFLHVYVKEGNLGVARMQD